MSDIRMRIADEIAGIVVGRSYYSTTIGITAALMAADALIAAGVVAEEPEWEWMVISEFDTGETMNSAPMREERAREIHSWSDEGISRTTLLRRRKAGPWVPVKREGADK